MKTTCTALLAAGGLLCAPGLALAAGYDPGAGFWSGPYAGGQIGLNQASADHLSTETALTGGVHGGYNFAVPVNGPYSPLILGGDVFVDFNGETTHSPDRNPFVGTVSYGSNVYGVDFMGGVPLGISRQWLPYLKVGFGTVDGTGDLHGSDTSARIGLGVQYHWLPDFGLVAQWMHQDADTITNDNFTVGLDYHFRGY